MSDGHCSKGDQKKGNYLLAVKENQKGLYEATEELFRRSSKREKNKLPQSGAYRKKRECPRSR